MLIVKTLTINDALTKLREAGMSIGPEKFKAAILSGVFPFAHIVPMEQDETIIFEKEFQDWLKVYGTEVEEPTEENPVILTKGA